MRTKIKLYKGGKGKEGKAYGWSDLKSKTIGINLKKNKDPKELKDTLIHEKLHLKHPNLKENKIKKLAKKYA